MRVRGGAVKVRAMQSMTARQAFAAGARDVLPLVVGIVPFGLVAGIAAVELGMGPAGASLFSMVVFAGSAQLAAIDLLARDAPLLVVVGTMAVINARHLMYAAALAPWLHDVPLARRVPVGYLLTDQTFAVSVARFASTSVEPGARSPARVRLAFVLGVAAPLWLNWLVTTLLGALGGAVVPDSWPLDFAIPLVFLALLVPAVTDRPTLVAAAVSGTVAVAGAGLPANLGLVVGALAGIAGGLLAGRHRQDEEVPA